jgi:hypothetical protein
MLVPIAPKTEHQRGKQVELQWIKSGFAKSEWSQE